VTSSTKPEVLSVLYSRRWMPEPRPPVTCTENVVQFGRVTFEKCERTDRQTYRHADRNTCPPTTGKVKMQTLINNADCSVVA